MAGQDTVALEMLDAVPDLDALVVSVGGGGLIAGMAMAARARNPAIKIVGVQTTRFPAMVNAVQGTHHVQGSSTIAEGIAVGTSGTLTLPLIEQWVDDLLLVDEGDIERAVLMLLKIEKTLLEEAGANIDERHHQSALRHAGGAKRRHRTGAADARPGPSGRHARRYSRGRI